MGYMKCSGCGTRRDTEYPWIIRAHSGKAYCKPECAVKRA